MNRREALSRVALLMGGVLSGPTLMAFKLPTATKAASSSISLTASQQSILSLVAEHILPKTNTPGAIDAGVPAFIQKMINDCYKSPDQTSFVAGLQSLEAQGFAAKSSAEQVQILSKLEAETAELMKARNVKQVKVGDNEDKEAMDTTPQGVPFWRLTKELTLLGYFTSEVGVNASFVYEPIPGKFTPTKLKPGQKAYAYLS
jgi:hypothetical protein